jgi:hypothetical protein
MAAAFHDMAAADFAMWWWCRFDIATFSISYLRQPTSVATNNTAIVTIVTCSNRRKVRISRRGIFWSSKPCRAYYRLGISNNMSNR